MTVNFGLSHWIRRPSLWLCIAAIFLSLTSTVTDILSVYNQSLLARATMVYFIMAPAIAAAAAWEASRFAHLVSFPSTRLIKVGAERLLPWSLFAAISYCFSLAIYMSPAQALRLPTFWLLLTYSLIVGLCWVMIGSALGLVCKPMIAIALAGLGGYGWYAVTPATSFFTLRRVTGDFSSCCDLNSTLDPGAVHVALLGSSALACIVIASTLLWKKRWWLAGASGSIGLAILLVSIQAADGLQDFGLKERPMTDMKCVDRVCARPEVPEILLHLNAQALKRFGELAPPELSHFANNTVTWSGPIEESLWFSGNESREGVLGDYVDQAVSVYLMNQQATLCGAPIRELGPVRSGAPWKETEPIDIEIARERLEYSLCGQGSGP